MNDNAEILSKAAELARSGRPFVLVTIVGTEGSTPRDAGAKLIWSESTGLVGTVGGGEFEQLVVARAEDHWRVRSCGRECFTLGRDARQCCGGRVEVFYEFIGPRRRVVIFGAGHVGKALADLLADAALEVIIVDDRPEWNRTDRFQQCRCVPEYNAGIALALEQPRATLACVMTCCHDTDLRIVAQLLEKPPAYIGLIGSAGKRASFRSRLAAMGIEPALIELVRCPIGVGDTGKEPRMVAISAAAEILMEAQRLEHL